MLISIQIQWNLYIKINNLKLFSKYQFFIYQLHFTLKNNYMGNLIKIVKMNFLYLKLIKFFINLKMILLYNDQHLRFLF